MTDGDGSGLTLSHRVGDHLRDMIFDGRLRPGQRLVSDALAEELGVSRVPVREALRQLDGSGLVEVRDRRGAVVVSIDQSGPEELLDLLAVRRQLEPWAAGLAAVRHEPADLVRLDAALRAGATAGSRGDLPRTGRAHHAVLQSVAAAAHNRVLLETLTPLHNRSAIAFSLIAHETLPDGWSSHQRVRAAIERRDPAAARGEARSHLDEVARAIRRRSTLWSSPAPSAAG